MKRILTTLIFASTLLAQAPATDALDALKGLKSVTEAGVNFRDYSSRVLDAKVKVDKYLADAPKDDPARPQAETAMRLYVMAMQTWAMKIQRKGTATPIGEEILASPELSSCPAMQSLITVVMKEAEKAKDTPARYLGYHLFTSQGVLWKCAAEKLEGLK